MVTSPFTRHSIVPRPRAQISSSDWVPGRRRPKSSGLKSGPRVAGPEKIIKIFVVQILYRLVRPAHSALHEGISWRFLHRSHSYFSIQLKFNLFEKNCSSNQNENLFDVLNAFFDGSYMVNEIDFSMYVRKTSKRQIKWFEYISCHKIMYLFVQLLHIETGWVIKGINSESAKLQTPEFKTQSHQELSRRCASMSNWYSASGWALCSLLGILWWNHWMCQRLSRSAVSGH